MNTESQIQKLEREVEELKASFTQSASTMEIQTTTLSFATQANIGMRDGSNVHGPAAQDWMRVYSEMYFHPQNDDTHFYCTECVQVTFTTNNNMNTLASLELNVLNNQYPSIRTTRIPFSGGARWLLHISPNVTSHSSGSNRYWTWEPTNLFIAVQSNANGVLEARMI